MSEKGLSSGAGEPPEAEVKQGRRISAVWIIPLAAVFIGAWLVYKTLSEKGPEITITFQTAAGLEAGKTQVKYKEVVVGTIASVALDPIDKSVKATAEMVSTAEPYLTDTTTFWVVRPRVGVKEISGLGTLVSGAYVGMDLGQGGRPKLDFTAVEVPPLIRAETPGTEIILTTTNLGSLSRGSPIYFKGLEVGEVTGYALAEDKRQIEIHAFVYAPHDQLVRQRTRFWNISGLEVSMDADGMKVEAGTLQSLILGGIEFETPDLLGSSEPVPAGTRFVLFDEEDDVEESAYTRKTLLIMYFNSSVRGLTIGAPVEFKGIRIGSVLDVQLEMDPETLTFLVPVLIEIEPERISVLGSAIISEEQTLQERKAGLSRLIARGFRARLKSGSFLTGQLVVELDMYPDAPVNLIGKNPAYLEVPTLPRSLEQVTDTLTELMAKLQKVPVGAISERLLSTLEGADRLANSGEIKVAVKSMTEAATRLNTLLANVDDTLVPEAAVALKQAQATLETAERALGSIDSVVSEDSALRYETQVAIQEISAAARSIRQFTEFLQRNPSALLTGKPPQ